ncbi:hypothetical protein Aph01nite_69700 [Acrocarpospora phusangensis]|uniref:Uncharacterized protein n=1 Tax=Acrocarpospora phusangensis TaxID=1070424 RepID=A0A919QLV9_9ACTN|nr:hypothetical protein [Acrocarpospora phusangensis]GIH28660.1 hypothetical protein Aph01nite_69700 [Acrocarpospora phusangensis]
MTSPSSANNPSLVAPTPDPAADEAMRRILRKVSRDPGTLSAAIVYLSDERDHAPVLAALAQAAEAFGLEIAEAGPQVRGSIWQAFVVRVRRYFTDERLEQSADKLKAGAEIRWYDEPAAQASKVQAEAVAALMAAVQESANAFILIGNLLLIKIDGFPYIRELTPAQVDYLQANPGLQANPAQALAEVDGEGPLDNSVTSSIPLLTDVPLDKITVQMVNNVINRVTPGYAVAAFSSSI